MDGPTGARLPLHQECLGEVARRKEQAIVVTLEFGAEVADVLADTSNDLVIRAADIAPHRKRRAGEGHKVGRSLHSGLPKHGKAAGSERKSAVRDDRSTTLKALGDLVIDDADLRTGEHDIGPRTEDGHRMTDLTEFVHTVGAVGANASLSSANEKPDSLVTVPVAVEIAVRRAPWPVTPSAIHGPRFSNPSIAMVLASSPTAW